MFLATAVLSWSAVLTVVSGSDYYSRTIYVDSVRGNDTKNCVEEPSYDQPCKSLSYAFQRQYRSNSTCYSLQPGTHYLDSSVSECTFTGLTDIAITGNTSNTSTVRILCFTENVGLSFVRVKSITLGNVVFTNCSARQNGTSKNISKTTKFELLFVQTALYFSDCEDISMESVVVTNSPNGTGLTVYNTIGKNTFTRCEFTNNCGPLNSPFSGGGGGVYIEFSYCIPGNNSCQNATEPSYTNSNSNSVYIFTECHFRGNSATSRPDNMIPSKQNHTSFGLGGGLSIFFCGNATGNTFLIRNCIFSGNSAKDGGGMFIEFADTSANNSVLVNDTSLLNNNCEISGGRGGGAYTSHIIFPGDKTIENSVSFKNCNISGNKAKKGGGLRIVATPQNNTPFQFSLSEVTFVVNRATDGGGALMVQMTDSSPGERSPNLFIQNCNFLNNSVNTDGYNGPKEVGVGIVYIEAIDVTFHGLIHFYNNLGSGLALVEARANLANT